MLITRERWTDKKAQPVEVFVKLYTEAPNWNPPYFDKGLIPYTVPSIRLKYSKLLSDDVWVKGAWKDCQHYKRWIDQSEYDLHGIPWIVRSYTDIGYYTTTRISGAPILLAYDALPRAQFGRFGDHTIGLPELIQEDSGDGFVPRPENLEELQNYSLRAMMPSIKAELSLVNSIIELKDFKSLPKTLMKLRDFGSSLYNAVKRRTKLSRGLSNIRKTFSPRDPTMSEALGVSADSYLQTQFNILPLLSDICGIRAAISKTKARVNDLLVRQGKRQHRHFTMHVPNLQAEQTDATILYGLGSTQQFQGTYSPDINLFTPCYREPYRTFECVRESSFTAHDLFHAQVEYNFSFTRFQTENAQLLGMMDALGINLNPAIIWNAIPWTFVIDWVINVSKWLDKRKVMNLEPAINISRYSWSYTTMRTTRTRIRTYPNTPWTHMPWMYLPDLYEQTYRRSSELPTYDSLLAVSGLSSRELSLGVALAITRKKRYSRRGR